MQRRRGGFFKGRVVFLVVGIFCLLGMGGKKCLAHPGNIASALAKVRPDGTFEVRLRFDLLAYCLNELPNKVGDAPMNALLDGPPAELESRIADAKERFRQSFQVVNGGPGAIEKIIFPRAVDVLQSVKNVRVRLPVMAFVTVSGHLPPGTKTVAFQFDEGLGAIVLTTEFPYQEPISEPVDAGAFSAELPIPSTESIAQAAAAFQTPVAAVKANVKAEMFPSAAVKTPAPAAKQVPTLLIPSLSPKTPPSETTATAAEKSLQVLMLLGTQIPAAPLRTAPSPSPTAAPLAPSPPEKPGLAVAVALRPVPMPKRAAQKPALLVWLMHFVLYVKMGYLHILPEGVDHILFILGLFLLSTQMKTLLKQVTAFTVAHSLTLGLSLYGWIHLPASVVEPIIAASIAFVAIENLFTSEAKPWRLGMVFGFGLIHGLGFASALQEAGLNQHNLFTGLLGFNVGVELGQLTVVTAAFLLVGQFRNHANYRKFVVLPGSLAIAATALFWTVERIL